MCGRYTNKLTWREIVELYRLVFDAGTAQAQWSPKFNIAPTTQIPVVYSPDGHRRMALMRWGLVPAWSKEVGKFATFNARSDGLDSKPAYRGAWKAGRRCLIPATSFFEWRKSDKAPFAIGLGNKGPFAFAGLWDEWKPANGDRLLSCTVITTEPNTLMAGIHDRMPVILDEEQWPKWLGEEAATGTELKAMLKPCAAERMAAWAVSKDVGNVRNETPDLIEPAA